MARLCAAAAVTAAGLFGAPSASAAVDTADSTFPIDPVTQLEVHTRADCRLAEKRCFWQAAANLRTPDGPTGFPPDLWARQTTTLRSNDRTIFLETDFNAPNTRLFKSLSQIELTTIYFGDGPVEKYQLNGDTIPTSWYNGQPVTDKDFIVCAEIQVVYTGVNITSPSTCAQARFS
nr:hypothetical protein [Mycobacterium sp. MYCO198283]